MISRLKSSKNAILLGTSIMIGVVIILRICEEIFI